MNDLDAASLLIDAWERWHLFPEGFDPTPLFVAWARAYYGDPED